jgi:hypothetical protein
MEESKDTALMIPEILYKVLSLSRKYYYSTNKVCRLWKDVADTIEAEPPHDADQTLKRKREDTPLGFARWKRKGTPLWTTFLAAQGDLSLLRWSLSEGAPHDNDTLCNVASLDDVETLECLKRYGSVPSTSACMRAARAGADKALMWLLTNGATYQSVIADIAADKGRLDVLYWLKQQGVKWGNYIGNFAALGGDLTTIQWLMNNGATFHAGACKNAAERGHKEVLLFLISKGITCDSRVLIWLASTGSLELIKELRDHPMLIFAWGANAEWGSMACAEAARGGHLDMLQWLRQIGTSCDMDTVYNAIENDHVHVAEWAVENGCPYDLDIQYLISKKRDSKTTRWLHEHLHCPVSV